MSNAKVRWRITLTSDLFNSDRVVIYGSFAELQSKIENRLNIIEKMLMIPERDVTIEKKYPALKEKYDEYIDALAKYRTFEAIKGDQNETA